jgi:uncharacterized protein
MNIDLIKLKSNIVDKIEIDEFLYFQKEDLEKAGILEMKEARVVGNITKIDQNNFYISARIYGTMMLPCSVTLTPVDYPFDIEIEGNIQEMLEEIGLFEKNLENTIDILPIIWENILMEIPMHIVSDKADNIKLQGEGWKMITDEVKSINPELEKLKDLLK